MGIIISIIVCLIVLSILWVLGVIQKFIIMLLSPAMIGVSSGIISWFFFSGFSRGWNAGCVIGIVLYLIYCISRIINIDIEETLLNNGNFDLISREVDDTNGRRRGIVGLIVFVGFLIWPLCY